MAKSDGGGLSCAISFFTVIPAACSDFSTSMLYWFFLPGLIIGILSGSAYYFLYMYTGPILAASGAVVLILVLSGFTHLDGVLDTGDALMFRGNVQRRREILKDHYLGAGAMGWTVAIYLPTFAALTVLNPLSGFVTIVLAEMASKASFVMGLEYGTPFSQTGLFALFHKFAMERGSVPLILNVALPLILSLLAGPPFLVASLVSIGLYLPVLILISRPFSGMNGDILGFLGEVTRLIYLLSAALSFTLIHVSLIV